MLKRSSLLSPSHWNKMSTNNSSNTSNSSGISHSSHLDSIHPLASNQVIMTNSIIKDYDTDSGNKMINHYMIIKEIGRGVHGKVKLAQDMNTGNYVAIKIIDKKNRKRQMGYSLLRGNNNNNICLLASKENELKIKREISILKKCRHPNVVQLIEVMDHPESRKLYMALEYNEYGEIEWRDENDRPILTIDEARKIFRDIVNGLDYLHYQGIIHRDIKPANLLLSHDHVAKISDFGVSYYNELLAVDCPIEPTEEMLSKMEKELAETAGTPAFFAPELCYAGDSCGKRPRISKAIDVWALGVTLFCFIFGQCPFTASTEFELFDTIPTQPLTFPSVDQVGFQIDDDLKDLLCKLLEKNPEKRITLDQVKTHPWVINGLEDPKEWLIRSNPTTYTIPVIHEDPSSTTLMDRLRQSIRKLSFSFGNNRRKSSRKSSTTTTRPLSYQLPPSTSNTATNHHHMHRLSQPTMNKQLSYSTSLLPHATNSVTPTVSLSTGHTLIMSSGLSSSIIPQPPLKPISAAASDEDDDIEHEYYSLKRPGYNRRVSTASSSASSGLGLTFGRYRGMTPVEVPK
ncbi:hypothetical protein RMCBS344292_03152 [Rhizopus microsporus]|nr:hypothetical protein RMCBS344292_03152 [Rhizopus microsporus]